MAREDGTARMRVRSAEAADVPQMTALYNHYVEHTAFTFDVDPWTVERRAEWVDRFEAVGPHRVLVADEAGRVVGFSWSGPWRSRPAYATSVETSVYCLDGETGRGVGRALYTELLAILEAESLRRAFAVITLPNEPSERLHRRFGYSRVGLLSEAGRKFGRFWDVSIWQRALGKG